MSVEDLKKYGQMCAENEEVRDKAKEIGMEDVEGQIAHAKSLGLTFSQSDLEALAQEAGVGQSDELSEEDLEKVAGGVVTTTVAAFAACVSAAAAAATATVAVGGAASKSW